MKRIEARLECLKLAAAHYGPQEKISQAKMFEEYLYSGPTEESEADTEKLPKEVRGNQGKIQVGNSNRAR